MRCDLVEGEESAKPVAGAALATAVGLAVLIGLGLWQLDRRAEKLALIGKIEARLAAAPVTLEQAVTAWRRDEDVEYLKVSLGGRFVNSEERYLFASEGGAVGWQVYTPFATGFHHVVFAPKLVMVNRGFVPDTLRDPATRKAGLIATPVTVTGFLRLPPRSRGMFDPENDAAGNHWYWRDLQGMIASLHKERLPKHSPFLPFVIEVDATPAPGGWPKGGATRLELPNRHLEYALTWFALAATLAAVFGAWSWRRLKLP